ncbi:hypothetical protein LguiB_032281 [Lonicera macranthoides]
MKGEKIKNLRREKKLRGVREREGEAASCGRRRSSCGFVVYFDAFVGEEGEGEGDVETIPTSPKRHHRQRKVEGWDVGNAIDHYHRYKEDVALMKWMGLDAYRFSISWSRILPTGKKSDGKNEEGVKFYRDLIDELHKNGIEPYVTLFHWDVPQALEDEYGGFRDHQIVEDYKDYVDICFTEFGKKVKHWITFNEPWSFSEGGYATGQLAPGRGDVSEDTDSSEGDPAREPYVVTHHQLLAHAKAVELYRTTYKKHQKGEIGIALNSLWVQPASQCEADKKAKERALNFTLNWFLDPVTVGKYPTEVEQIMRCRKIDTFTATESSMLKGSIDFLGINYYTSLYARNNPGIADEKNPNYTTDCKVEYPGDRLPLGENWGAVSWLRVYPQGLKELLIYIKSKYNGPIYITVNGVGGCPCQAMIDHGIPMIDHGSFCLKASLYHDRSWHTHDRSCSWEIPQISILRAFTSA